MNASEVAARMMESLNENQQLLRSDAIERICRPCGPQFISEDQSGVPGISQAVLREFKRLHCGKAKWDQTPGRWYFPEE